MLHRGHRRNARKALSRPALCLTLALTLPGLAALAQGSDPQSQSGGDPQFQSGGNAQPQGRRGAYAGMGRVAGEIAAVNGTTLTVKAEDGSTVEVVTTDNTRVMKDRGPVKVSDLHVGDGLMAFGNMDAPNHTLHAGMVMAEDAAQVKAMRDNLGKTYITGRVTAVDLDDAKMTVERPDHKAQTIGFDESTSFKRAVRREQAPESNSNMPDSASGNAGTPAAGNSQAGGRGRGLGMMGDPAAALDRGWARGDSITLADIRVGDFVVGTGSVKAGTFVPTRLMDSPPGQHRQHNPAPQPAGPGGA